MDYIKKRFKELQKTMDGMSEEERDKARESVKKEIQRLSEFLYVEEEDE